MANKAVLYYNVLEQERITATSITTTTNGSATIGTASILLSVDDVFTLNNYAGILTATTTLSTHTVTVDATKNTAWRDPVVGDKAYFLSQNGLDVTITKKRKVTEFAQFGEWKSAYNQEDSEFVELLLPPFRDADLRNQLAIDIATAPAMVLYDCDTQEYWKVVSGGRSIEAVGVYSQPKLTLEVIL